MSSFMLEASKGTSSNSDNNYIVNSSYSHKTNSRRGSAVQLNGHIPPNGHFPLNKAMTTTDDASHYTHRSAHQGSSSHGTNSRRHNNSDVKSAHRPNVRRRQRRRLANLQRWIETFPDPFILCDPYGIILASNQVAKDTFGSVLYLKRPLCTPSSSSPTNTSHRNGVDSFQLNDLFDLLAPTSSKHYKHANRGACLAQRSTSQTLGAELTEPAMARSCCQQQQPDSLDDRYPVCPAEIQSVLPTKRIVHRKTCHGDQRLFLESLAPVYGCGCCKDRCQCPDSDEGTYNESDEQDHWQTHNNNYNNNGYVDSELTPWLRKVYTTTQTTGLEPVVGYSVVLTDLSRVLPESIVSSWSILEHASLPTPPGASDGGDRPSLDLDQSTDKSDPIATTAAIEATLMSPSSATLTPQTESRPPTLRQHHHPPRVAPDKQATDARTTITARSLDALEGRVAVAASNASIADVSTSVGMTTLAPDNSSTFDGLSSLRSLPPLPPSLSLLPPRDVFSTPPTPPLSASSRLSSLHLPPAASFSTSSSSSSSSSTSTPYSLPSTTPAIPPTSSSSSPLPLSRPRSRSAVPSPSHATSPSFLSAAHRSSSSTSSVQSSSAAASSIVSPPHSPLHTAATSKDSAWMPSYMLSAGAADTALTPVPKHNHNNSKLGHAHTNSHSVSHYHHHHHHHHPYHHHHHHHHYSSTGSEEEDPYFSFLAPIATQLLSLQGDALFDHVVQIVATQLRVKYCFVSQLLTLDELKELEPGEYAALVEQFGGQVPPIDGVMHNLSSWSGEVHVNPRAFQGYMVDLTIQEQWTAVNKDLALIHPDVAESLMDTTIKSHVGVRLESEHGDIMGVLGVIHDHEMTDQDVSMIRSVLERVGVRVANELDRFRIEANLVYQREVAESTAKNKTKFLADMSHEIRNPMNAVVGVTEILLDTEGLTDEQASLVGVIRTSGQHLLTVINDILDISRIDQDVKFLLEMRPLSLRKCLKDAVSLAGLTPQHDVSRQISVIEWPPEMDDLGPFTELEETNILPLLWSIDHDVPEHLLGDITRLRQVLINLCTNSLKFTQHGRVSVHVSIHKPQQQHGVTGSMPTSPMLTGSESRQQMVFEQRYDVRTEVPQNSRPAGSRRRPLDSVLASKSRATNGNVKGSSSSSSLQHPPPSMKVVAPTANTLDNDSLDENTVILEFAVSDTGVGIPANKITELFTSFSQVDISVSTRFGGTGLGLAISASLVEKMGGHIWVESTEGVGSRFTFTIPFTVCHPSEAEACTTTPSSPILAPFSSDEHHSPELDTDRLHDALERIGSSATELAPVPTSDSPYSPPTKSPQAGLEEMQPVGSATLSPIASIAPPSQNTRTYAKVVESSIKPLTIDGPPLRILLAEDNPVNQKVALGVLRKLGYCNVDVAQNGLEVISKLDLGHVYDLILMDVSMPIMDGIEATKTIVERRLRGLMYAHTKGDSAPSSPASNEHDQQQRQDSTLACEEKEPANISLLPPPSPLTTDEEPREAVLLRDYKDLYVIALTASAMGTDKERCMDAGMDDFMTKPFAAPEMKRVLSAFVEQRVRGQLSIRNEKQLQQALEKKNRCHSPGCLQKKSSDSSINSEKSGLPTLYRSKSPSRWDSTPCQGCEGGISSKDSEEEAGSSSQRPSRLDTPRPLRKVDSTLSSFLSSSRSGSDAGLHGLLPSKVGSPTTTPCMLSSLDERILDRRRSQEQQNRSATMALSDENERSSSHSPIPREVQRNAAADPEDYQTPCDESKVDIQQQQQQQQT